MPTRNNTFKHMWPKGVPPQLLKLQKKNQCKRFVGEELTTQGRSYTVGKAGIQF